MVAAVTADAPRALRRVSLCTLRWPAKGPAVARGLLVAHAGDLEQLGKGARRFLRHVGERRIGKDDVGGDALAFGKLRAPGAQRLVKAVFLEFVRKRAARTLFLRLRFYPLLHQHAFAVKEHGGCFFVGLSVE